MNLLVIVLLALQRSMGHLEVETTLSWLGAKLNLTSVSHQPPTIWITQLLEPLDQRFAENGMMIVRLKLHRNSFDSVSRRVSRKWGSRSGEHRQQ